MKLHTSIVVFSMLSGALAGSGIGQKCTMPPTFEAPSYKYKYGFCKENGSNRQIACSMTNPCNYDSHECSIYVQGSVPYASCSP
ncbi:hypothetical protein PTNB73_10273 [Pyrenophora teres f. teres]|nr:hypothetical protein HRS9122_08409 [Pyrenophora teres f. teres]KAE8854843.1 hypothetical protein PTNB73_10273 [Pyrenophora teres f. teres]